MKAEELMIGDWVIVYEKAMPVKERVDGVYGNNAFVLGHPRIVENGFVKPIRLTPEILENNGFRHEANKNYVCYVGKAKIAVQFRDKVAIQVSNEFRGKDNNGRADLVSFLLDWSDVLYVHYLQHILRLCGIDKTIEL